MLWIRTVQRTRCVAHDPGQELMILKHAARFAGRDWKSSVFRERERFQQIMPLSK